MDGIYKLEDIPIAELICTLDICKRQKGQRKRKKEKPLIDVVTAFDIETSTIWRYEGQQYGDRKLIVRNPHSFMYVWQFQLGEKYTIMGRTWEEYTKLLQILQYIAVKLRERLKLSATPLFVCYIHNLAFEWQFLQGIYDFEPDQVFFSDPRKPYYARYGNFIEYRCSYKQSNRSLDNFAENMGCKLRKLDGALFDYRKLRYPWTELSEYELNYCVNDVRVLEECIRLELERDHDTLLTIPLTSTGYPRKDCKAALKPIHFSISQILPDLPTYRLLRRCFRGGDVHANRYRVGRIWKDVDTDDITSSYPYQMMKADFPMGPFKTLSDDDNTLIRVLRLIKNGKCVIADYAFKGLRLKDPKDPVPYLAINKCQCINAYEDNGRILSADLCVTALTEIDLQIVLDSYEWTDCKIYNAMTALKGYLPRAFRDVVLNYYKKKTELKDVKGQEYNYQKLKNLLNACFGMLVQDPVHEQIYYFREDEDQYKVIVPSEEDAEKELSKASFPYQWGVYVCALARRDLRRGMALIGKDENGVSNLLYVDTDCCKYLGKADFDKLNKQIIAFSKKEGCYAKDIKGRIHYLGEWSKDPSYDEFITQGAKRYAYTRKGKLGVTTAGVSTALHKYYKEDGSLDEEKTTSYAAEELRTLRRFHPGMRWSKAGGTMAVYNDHDHITINIGEHSLEITPNVSIVDTTYTMTFPEEYAHLIRDVAEADHMRRIKKDWR